MPSGSMSTVILQLRKAICRQGEAGLTDAQLLERFIEHRDEAAFAALVARHGSMVMGVCLRVARNHQDAEDAFQAAFLVLARKAASISSRELLANWLYGVAHNTALKARASSVKRHAKEKQVTEMPEPAVAEQELRNDNLQALLDQELSRLPDKYRVPIILCDLEGKTRKDAAQQLGCPEGSLSSRLSRARVMLGKRLARHGLAISGGSLAAVLSQQAASACVPTSVATATIKAATLYATGQSTAGVVSASVTALTQGVLKTMLLSKLKIGTMWLLVSLIAFGASSLIYRTAMAQPATLQRADATTPKETAKDRSLPDDEIKKDSDALQGRWSVVTMILDGDEPPAEIVKAVVVVFKGSAMTYDPGLSIDATEKGKIKYNVDPEPDEMQFTLPPNSNPKAIVFTALEPDDKVRAMNAIYKFNEDTLTLCFGEVGAPSPVEFTAKKGSKQALLVVKRLPQKENPENAPAREEPNFEKDTKVQEALKQFIEEEGVAKRGPKFFRLAMLLNPVAHTEPPTISESTAFKLLGEPDLFQELGVRNADDAWVEKTTKYIYLVDNSKGQTIPKGSKMAAGEKIAVAVTVRDGNVVSTGWNTGPLKEDPPLYQRYNARTDAKPPGDRKGASEAMPIKQSWEGIIQERNLLKESPPAGFVVEAEAWEKMWKSWRAKEKVPAIDFQKQMAIILTVPGPNRIVSPDLHIDQTGNLKVPMPTSTLLPDDGRIGYKIVIIDRSGIVSVNGRAIK